MHLRSSDANVISGGIYIYIYYILYNRTAIPIIISDAFAIFCCDWNLWWDLHIYLLNSIYYIIEPLIQS